LTQTLPRTLIEQDGFQSVVSDGGGTKYQLKKKSEELKSQHLDGIQPLAIKNASPFRLTL
jgi:hypothetical protein